MNGATRGVRNAFRNPTRTVSIVVILGLSVGLALAMLVAHQAVGDKIKSVQASVGNTVSVSPAGLRGFSGGGNPLTLDQITKIKQVSHVTGVNETLNDRLTTTNSSLVSAVDAGSLGRRFFAQEQDTTSTAPALTTPGVTDNAGGFRRAFSPGVTLVGTTSPTDLSSSFAQGGGTFKLKSGTVFSTTSTDKVALVGSTLATKNNLTVGSTFTAYDATITVAGIFDAGNNFSNNQVIMPLSTVQTLSAQPNEFTGAVATVDSVTHIDSVTAAITTALGSAADVTNDAARAKTTIAPLQNIQTISLYSLVGAVIAGSVIILLTMIMIVRERRREIGVVKAIGASNLKVMGQFMVEAVTLTLMGSVIGIVLGVIAGKPITNLLVTNSTSSVASDGMQTGVRRFGGGNGAGRAFNSLHSSITSINASVGWDIILYGLGAALVIALIGSAIASFFIAKVRPAEVMRAE